MTIKVIYHSSTGNTEKLARVIADTLNVQAEPLGEEPVAFSAPVDMLFIGDGMYFGKPSKRIRSFIQQLDPKMVKRAAVFATYGGQAKIGSDIKELLQSKGIAFAAEPFTCKGQSWLLINRNHPDESDFNKARKYAKDAVAKANK